MGLTMMTSATNRGNSKRPSQRPNGDLPAAAADESDGDAFDRERRRARVDDDRLESGVLGKQDDVAAAFAQPLDGHFVAGSAADTRDDDLTVARFARAMHG